MFNWLKKMLGYRVEFTAEEARRMSEQGDWKDVLFPKIKEVAKGMNRIQLDYDMIKIVDDHIEELHDLGFYKINRTVRIWEEPCGENIVKCHYANLTFLTWDEEEVGV